MGTFDLSNIISPFTPISSLYGLKNALKTNARANQKCQVLKPSGFSLLIAKNSRLFPKCFSFLIAFSIQNFIIKHIIPINLFFFIDLTVVFVKCEHRIADYSIIFFHILPTSFLILLN